MPKLVHVWPQLKVPPDFQNCTGLKCTVAPQNKLILGWKSQACKEEKRKQKQKQVNAVDQIHTEIHVLESLSSTVKDLQAVRL